MQYKLSRSEKITNLFVSLIVEAVQSWQLMLGVGILHGSWEKLPSLSYWTSFAVVFFIGGAFYPTRRASEQIAMDRWTAKSLLQMKMENQWTAMPKSEQDK